MEKLEIGQRVRLKNTDVTPRTVIIDTRLTWLLKREYQIMYQLPDGKMNFIQWLDRKSLVKVT